LNTDERRAKIIVAQELQAMKKVVPEFDKLFQEFISSDFRKGIGNQKPYALAVAFSMWLGSYKK
jgi:hypothetical protein